MTANSDQPSASRKSPKKESLKKALPPISGRFASLDFETADYGRDSACAVSIVLVEKERVIEQWTSLIRPPRREFVFTYLHGISWSDVKDKPAFADLRAEFARLLDGVDFVAAHNASFDRSVLRACCENALIPSIKKPFLCTVKVARALWDLHPTKLSDVCRHLKIPLKHHNAASDALACAHIVLAARAKGHDYPALLKSHALKG